MALSTLSSLAMAQERAAGGSADLQMTWTSLKLMADQANDNAKIAVMAANDARAKADGIIACNAKKMFYAPADATKDAQGCIKGMDPQKLDMQTGTFNYSGGVGCGSGAHTCATDSTTAKKVCQALGYNSATGVGTASYSSPKNNWIGKWTGSSWSVFNARQNNVYMRSITCMKFTYE